MLDMRVGRLSDESDEDVVHVNRVVVFLGLAGQGAGERYLGPMKFCRGDVAGTKTERQSRLTDLYLDSAMQAALRRFASLPISR